MWSNLSVFFTTREQTKDKKHKKHQKKQRHKNWHNNRLKKFKSVYLFIGSFK